MMNSFFVYFNGETLPIKVLSSFSRGFMIGESEITTQDISDNDGTVVVSSRIKEGIIDIPFFIKRGQPNIQDEIMRILNVDEPRKLQFSDQMDRYYQAIPNGKINEEEVSKWIRKGSIPFLIPSGVAYSEEEIEISNKDSSPRDSTLLIRNDGSHKTAPDFLFEFEEDNGYIGVVHEDGIIQYGFPEEVDGVVKQKSITLIQDRFDSNKGWQINSKDAVTMMPMAANGTVEWNKEQSFVYPTNYGTGSGWHGVTLTQKLSQQASNFTLESLSRLEDRFAEKVGRIEFTLSAADGTRLWTFQIRNDAVSSSQNNLWAYVGDQEVERDTTTWDWRFWIGNFTLKKAGNLWQWTFQNGKKRRTLSYTDSAFLVSNKKVDRITIAFAAYGNKKPILWDKLQKENGSGLGWSELRFVQDNVDYWQDLPNKMKAGDTVEIRNTEGKIYKYWQNQEPMQDMLDADIGNQYFTLSPGENKVEFHFSDFMSEPPIITAKFRKVYR
ncbi:phage tail family protein [Enterococcus hulanensis]|uniref:distal tail protein Dit n=1 Tax=Enterococcus hulanensis TaxID=2559929 RepID=UPI002890E85E|nr:distal tail protein Dit [Enterococcus hulanensis]MDT2660706.1 phage tail family protein [Enterococcus hulanensis]